MFFVLWFVVAVPGSIFSAWLIYFRKGLHLHQHGCFTQRKPGNPRLEVIKANICKAQALLARVTPELAHSSLAESGQDHTELGGSGTLAAVAEAITEEGGVI